MKYNKTEHILLHKIKNTDLIKKDNLAFSSRYQNLHATAIQKRFAEIKLFRANYLIFSTEKQNLSSTSYHFNIPAICSFLFT